MSISGTTSTSDSEPDLSLNANTDATSTPLTMGEAKLVGFYITANSGDHENHVATLQVSPDEEGDNWFNTDHTVKGIGQIHDALCSTERVRVKITTPEGMTSTVDIKVIIK